MSLTFRKPRLAAATALLAMLLSPAAQAEAVTNGGFNTGTFEGWTIAGIVSLECAYAVSGPCAGKLRSWGGVSSLSQTLATVAGATYDYSFYLDNGDLSEISFVAGGDVAYSLSNAPDSLGFFQVTGSFVATGASTTIAFNLTSSGGNALHVDELSVIGPTPTATGVPEPASLLLASTALVGLGLSLRRRAA